MTNEEAVKMLTAFRKEDGITELFRELNSEVVDSQKELLDFCIQALEKQIPKKPKDKAKFADLYIGICPVCGEGVNSEYPYCGKCGQLTDWRDSNE